MPKVRKHGWLAVRLGSPTDPTIHDYGRMWDMLRYDACYPATNGDLHQPNWVLLKQPEREGIKPIFTIERWNSMGYYHFVFGVGPQQPMDIRETVAAAEAQIVRDKLTRPVVWSA